MSQLRLLFVLQRFWPLVGGTEKTMAHLAAELADRACPTTILTVQWQPAWPAQICLRGVPVIRLGPPPQGLWRTWRYVRSLREWFRHHADRFDLVYVSGLRHEAYAAIKELGRQCPVVLRPETVGRGGDCVWQVESAAARRIKRHCLRATAFVAASRPRQRELQAAGYPRARIHYLQDGVPLPAPTDAAYKLAARQALAEANPSLQLPDEGPLAVFVGRLQGGQGLSDLVAAWDGVVAHRPKARLWLVGHGPQHSDLVAQIDALGLAGRVVLAGAFDEVDPLLGAADLFVLPAREARSGIALLEAMAAGLPIVASDIRAHRDLVIHNQHGLLVRPQDPEALAEAVLHCLDHPHDANRLATAARERVSRDFSLAKMVDAHLTLFEQLVDRP